MSIGSIIRTESNSALITERYAQARRQPIVLPRRYTRRRDDDRKEQ